MRPIAAALLLALFAAPVMACLMPDAQLTPAERSCCRRMAHQCAGMQGLGAHSCCAKSNSSAAPFLVTSSFAVAPDHVPAVLLPAHAAQFGLAALISADPSLAIAHSPPIPPARSAVLRI